MKPNKPNFIHRFLANTKDYPILYAVAAGLYPILFYYFSNYSLVNSWYHVGYFMLFFLLVPIVVFFIAFRIFGFPKFKNWRKYVLPFLNLFTFLLLLNICLFTTVYLIIILGIFIVSCLFSYFFYAHFKKLVVFQMLLISVGMVMLMTTLFQRYNYSNDWMLQPDDIENVVFKKTPNVYYIQPDGYLNFSELEKGFYQVDNSYFESFLDENGFTYYRDFRSNYDSTLNSNSANFMMKHHYYLDDHQFSETINARDIIISRNPVLEIFKKNNYQTYFLSEKPYLMLNRPKMGYDVCNISYEDVPYLGTGLTTNVDVVPFLTTYLNTRSQSPTFFFIEIFNPGHIQNVQINSQEVEKELWLKSLARANKKIEDMITIIKEKDPEALILMMADHGGFVGLDAINDINTKTQNRDKIYSIFSSSLAIHWPNNDDPVYESVLKSSVNVFRVLFSYLGEEESYLDYLQPNESYITIKKGAVPGVYQYIDDQGKIVFKKR